MLKSAHACGMGLVAALGDLVESTNYTLRKGYNGHSSRGRVAGQSVVEREPTVVQRVWDGWFHTPRCAPPLHF